MSGVTIGWTETNPADNENAGLGASDIRSVMTNARTALDAEHVWPSTDGLHGAHRAGSARAFYGTTSQVSSADTDGRLMVTSNGSRLYHVGSADTIPLGGRLVLFGPQTYVHPFGSVVSITTGASWQIACGTGSIKTTSAGTTVSFGQSFTTTPLVFVGRLGVSTGSQFPVVQETLSATTARVTNTTYEGVAPAPADEYTFFWYAMGFVNS